MAANTYTTYGVAAGDSSEGLVRVVMEGDALAQPSEQAMEETLPASRFVDGTAALELEPYPGTVQVWRGSVSEDNLMDEADYVVEGAEISIGELQSDPVALVSYDTTVERELTRADFAGGAVELGGEPSSLTLTEDGEPVAYTLDGSTLYVAGMGEPDGYVVATYTHPVELTCYPGETTLPDAPDSIVVVGRTLGDTPSEEPVDDYELSGAVLVLPSTYEEYGVSYDAPMEERWSLSGQVEDIPAPDSEEGETGSLEPSQELVGHILQWEPEGLVVTVDGEVTVGYTLDGQTLTVAMPSVEDRLLELSCTMAEELLVMSSALREPYVLPSLPSGEVSVTIGGSEVPCTLDGLELTVPSLQAGEYVVSYTGQAPQEAVEMACIPSVSEGEAVVVTVVDGVPMVTGTVGSGDSMQGQVDDAVTLAVDASTAADAAEQAAAEAAEIAAAVGQHVWDDSDGEHVTEATKDEFLSNPSGRNILMNALGILLRDALINLVQLSRSGMSIYDGQGNASSNVVAQFTQNLISLSPQPESSTSTASIELFDGQGLIECIFGETRSRLNLSAGSVWAMGYNSANLSATTGRGESHLSLGGYGTLELVLRDLYNTAKTWSIDADTNIIHGPSSVIDIDRTIDFHVTPSNRATYDCRIIAATDGTNLSFMVRDPANVNEITQFYMQGGAATNKGRIMQRTTTDGGSTWGTQHGVRSPWTSLGTATNTGSITIDLSGYEELCIAAKANGKLVTATIPKQLLTTSSQEVWLGGGKSSGATANSGNLRAVVNVTTTKITGVNFSEGSTNRTSSTTWYAYAR